MQHPAERSEQRRLSQTRHTLEQNVAARDETNEHAVHDLMLTDDDLRNFLADAIQPDYR